MIQRSFDTSVGRVTVGAVDGWLTHLAWGGDHDDDDRLLHEAQAQVLAYLDGRLRDFDLPLGPQASPFQHCYNEALFSIRYGETRTYGQLARALEVTPQAVGQACGANPLPIILPCHRVLAADGLGGYSGRGGVETKVALLKLEGGGGLLL